MRSMTARRLYHGDGQAPHEGLSGDYARFEFEGLGTT